MSVPLPPKSLRDQVRQLDRKARTIDVEAAAWTEPQPTGPGNAAPEAAAVPVPTEECTAIIPGTTPGSLPVLEAFQQFLEQERLRTRRRMLIWSTALAGAFALVLATGATVAYRMVASARSDVLRAQAEFKTLQSAVQNSDSETLARIENLARETSGLKDRIQETQQAAPVPAPEPFADPQRLEALAQMVTALQQEASQNSTGTSRPREPRPWTVKPLKPSRPQVRRDVVLSITPTGASQGVEWRLPIPE
jgi:hypothetical protein